MGAATRRDRAREHWFRASVAAWAADAPSTFAGLTLADVHRAAGRSERAFYGLWSSIEDFRAELTAWALEPDPVRMSSQATLDALDEIRSALEAGASAPELIRFVAITDQQAYREPERAGWQAAVVASMVQARTDESVRDQVRVQYDALLDRLISAYETILQAWRRRPRQPWTIEECATGLMYLSEGAILHGMFEPRLTDDQFADLVLALLASITEPDSAVGIHFDQYASTTLRAGPTDATGSEGSVATTVLLLYRDQGWSALEPRRVSAHTTVGVDVLEQRLGPLPDGFAELIWTSLTRTLRDLDPVGDPPAERVRTLLHRLRDLAEAHPDAAAALLRTSVDRASDAALVELVAGPIAIFASHVDLPTTALAASLVRTTLGLAVGPADTRLGRQASHRFIDRFLVEQLLAEAPSSLAAE